MSHAVNTRLAGLNLADALAGLVHRTTEALRARADYRRTVRELSALSDRELADIGIGRCEIQDIAASTALSR